MDKKDMFHYGCAGAIIVVYLYLVITGQVAKEGFEYMAGSVIGAVLGISATKKNEDTVKVTDNQPKTGV